MSMLARARLATYSLLVVGLAMTVASPVLALRGPASMDRESAADTAAAIQAADAAASATTPGPSPTPTPTSTSTPTPVADPAQELAASWAALEAELTGQVGLVVMPVGGAAEDVVRFGQAPGGIAWSTAKVPIAIAADIAAPDSPQVDAQITSAIRYSDNEAVLALWSGLGSSTQARAATDAVLAAAGDTTTRIGQNADLGTTTFGYTTWRLADQAVFTAGIACLPAAAPVVTEMRDVVVEQRWGLGVLEGTALKGGWGTDGAVSTSRQMGLVPVGGALGPDTPTLAVAMSVENPAGDGTAELTRVAGWLQDNLDAFPAGTCALQ